MRTKTPVGHRRRAVSPPPPSTTQDEYNETIFETSSESDGKQQQFHMADCIQQNESVDMLDKNICVCCNQGGGVLVCSQTACSVTLHVNCLDSEPKFDDLGNFYCPYCWYKRAVDKSQELREKAMTAKKALSSFLDKNGGSKMKEVIVGDGGDKGAGVQSQDVASDKGAEETVANPAENKGRIKDKGKLPHVEQEMSSTSSSMSEANDSDFEVVSLNKGCVKRKLPVTLYPQKKNASDNEEVTSSRTSRQPHTTSNYACSRNQSFLAGRRKILRWTVEEETALKEGVLKFSTKNEKIPWKRILEFGSRVFDKTRTPIDLKDKWRNISSRGR